MIRTSRITRAVYRSVAVLSLVLALSTLAPLASAQVSARIKGTVTDPAGAVVPSVTVVATNQETGVKLTTTTTSTGDYLFPSLPIGTYTISASAPGFKGFTATGIVLNIDQEYVEPVKLALGNATDQVQVEADTVQVNTTDMQLNNIINSAQMVELPLIGRNFTSLELTLPGVQFADTRFGGTYSVSGQQAQQSEYLINGADTNDIALNTIAIVPNLDAIAQFNLIDGPLNAEYDRNSGGIVTASIVQGTNHFHGDIFEFYRDTFLNTNNFYQKTFSGGVRTDTVSPYHQHIFGGTVGGFIFKDKLFFFGAYQGTRQRVPGSGGSASVFTSSQLGGNFSTDLTGAGQAGISSFSSNVIPSTINIPGCMAGVQTFAQCLTPKGGIISPTAFNSIASTLVSKYVPAPNNGTFGYGFNSTSRTTQDQYIGRVDYSPTTKDQVTVVGIYQKGVTSNTIPFSGASIPGFGDGSLSHIQQWTIDYTRQLSSTAVNDLAAHYTRFNFNTGAPQQVVQPSSVGFAITPQDTASSTIPTIGITGYFTLGGTNNGPQPRIDQVIQLDDNFSKTFGRHNLKFGYDGRRFNVSNIFDNSNSGSFSFGGSGTYTSGDPGLDFLLGIPDTYTQGTGSVIQADAFLNYVYAQDSWRVKDALTLNYGLGYSIDTPLRNHQYGGLAVACFVNGQQSKIFPGAPKNLNFPGDPGCYNSGQATIHYTEFGPRFGFAWSPDLGRISGGSGKFSIRGGFGIYFDRSEEETALQTLATPPFGFTSAGAAEAGAGAGVPSFKNPFADINGSAANSEANRFPYVFPTKGQNVDFSGLEPIVNISSFDAGFRSPYSENFQLSIEREFPSKIVARVSYVGALSRHNQYSYEGNYETAAGHAACVASTTCIANRNTQALAFPGNKVGNSALIAEIGEVGSEAASNYNSLQVGITKAETHGLGFQISYTYAHAMDNASSFENAGFGESGARGYNQYNTSLNYGDSTFDARHHLVIAPVYRVPGIKGQSAFSPLNLLLTGWEVSAIAQFATGFPYDISYAGATSRSLYCDAALSFYACPDVPLQTAPLVRSDPRTTRSAVTGRSSYFATTSFAAEPIGQFGNIHRDPYHGPGTDLTNAVFSKNFNLRADGSMRLQLRMESDNVFNHTNFSNPTTSYTSGAFGQVSGAGTARQTVLGAKFYF